MQISEKSISTTLASIFKDHPMAGGAVQLRGSDGTLLTVTSERFRATNAAQVKFPIYSIAKTLLAIFALKLAENGRLELDQPIGTLLRRPLPGWLQTISLRLLLSHRSGLLDYGSMKAYHEAVKKHPDRAISPDHFVSQVIAKGPQFEPDTSFLYSNVGYFFVREIVATVSGKGLQELVDELVCAPLSINMKLLVGLSRNFSCGIV